MNALLSNMSGRVFGISPKALALAGNKHPEARALSKLAENAAAVMAFRRSIVNNMKHQPKPRPKARPKTSWENMRALQAALLGESARARNLARLAHVLKPNS